MTDTRTRGEFVLERAEGVWVWDDQGGRYFDASASLWCRAARARELVGTARAG